MQSRTAWQALTEPGFPVSAWPWRSTAYLLSGVLMGTATLVVVATVFTVGAVSSLVLVGVPLLLALGLSGLPVAAIERRRLRFVDGEPMPTPHREPGRPGIGPWLRTRYREQATWRELAYTLVLAVVLWPLDLAAITLGLVIPGALLIEPLLLAVSPHHETRVLKTWTITGTPQAWGVAACGLAALVPAIYALTAVAAARASLTRLLIAPRETELNERIDELTWSRARLVDTFETERRRIERDLHDGAQQRLVALKMTLGLARLAEGPEATGLIVKAHDQAGLVLDELRELVRGIHPRILTDRGLPAAVADVADRCPVPVRVDIDLPCRLPDPVEAAIYFAICEALTNTAKHGGARRASVRAARRQDQIIVEIEDDGVGGAGADRGTGLAGLRDRIAVINGRLVLSSPHGGPTLLRLELPCPPPTHRPTGRSRSE